MVGHLVRRGSFRLAVALSLVTLLAATCPALAQADPATTATTVALRDDDLSRFIVASNDIHQPFANEIQLWHEGDSVEFRGQITIRVVTQGPKSSTSREYIIGEGQTKVVALADEYSTEHPGDWNILITLVSAWTLDLAWLDPPWGSGGSGTKEQISAYIQAQQPTRGSLQQAQVSAGFVTKYVPSCKWAEGVDKALVNQAAEVYATYFYLASLRDKDGHRLFPSFAKGPVLKLAGKLLRLAAESEHGYLGLQTLLSMLIQNDMAKHEGRKAT